ncbi:MAG TPA: dienelactone hydrolase family protein, partial [Tepidisphaeraceae bacterium]|nr:dienelactone hydrolase family protein [Tepidisphaeraceae bacterium]
EWTADGVTYKSVAALDDAATGKRPGVLVFPEWWGLTDYPVTRAKQLAELGYVALAVDMYGDGKTTTDPKQAGEWAGAVKQGAGLRTRAQAALEQLRKMGNVDGSRVAAIGYCFGGSTALELARSGADVRGVVALHAGLDFATAPAEQIPARVLLLTGSADPMVPLEQVKAFMDQLDAAGVTHEVTVYSGAKHAFSNPNADSYGLPPVGYNKTADARSFDAMRTFLADVLR